MLYDLPSKLSSKVDSGDLKTLRDNVSSWSSSKDNFDFGSDSRAGSSRSAGSQPSAAEPVRVIGPSRGPVGDTGRVMPLILQHAPI